jgi:hypothetical protein
MAITEESRHRMYQRLEELLGKDEATTLMEHLPPVGWADIATKRDLDHLATSMDLKLDHLATSMDLKLENMANILRTEFARGLNRQTLTMMATNMVLISIVLAITRLI